MKYQSHSVAYNHFVVALLLLGLQVIAGLFIATQYVFPDFFYQVIDFNVMRTIHINLLIVWILIGFMGASYYLVVEESETEVWSPALANIHLVGFVIGGVTAIVGYLFGWTDGREFLEQPFIIKLAITVVVLAFVLNIIMTIVKGCRWTSIQIVLVMGLVGAALFLLPALGNHVGAYKNLSVVKFNWFGISPSKESNALSSDSLPSWMSDGKGAENEFMHRPPSLPVASRQRGLLRCRASTPPRNA